ncbi:MAG: hypothetical protein R2797_01985 [Gelidibacter sp.]
MQSSKHTLSFYFDMLFVNSIEQVTQSFVGNPNFYEQGYSYVQQFDYYIKDVMVEEDDIMPIFETDIIERKDFLEWLLNIENIKFYKRLNEDLSFLSDNKDKSDYLKNIYNDIQVLIRRLIKFEHADTEIVEDKLIEIINNLKDRYSAILTYHDVFKYLIKETDITFFKNKDLKYSFYVDLYECAYTLYLIDDTEIEEIDFINAFTSPNPQLLKKKIRFSVNNYVLSYFLESLKPFFNGFSHAAIEKSEVFLNKQNKPLKSTDIYVSLSRGKGKIEFEKTKIDSHLLDLKNKHLK